MIISKQHLKEKMDRILIKDLSKFIGQEVKVQGFASIIRDQKAVQFIVLRDNTGLVQLIHERKDDKDEISKTISKLNTESTIEAIGKIVENPRVKLNGLEIILENLKIVSSAEPTLPIDISKNTTSLDKRLDFRFLDLRRPENLLIFKVQTTAEKSMRDFWDENGFLEIHSPKFISTASESGSELFEVKYFDQKAYLAQSPQFYKQMAMAAGFDRVFEIGPVFRANPSFTSRHDTEFTSVDMEISWIESHEDVMKLEEEWLTYVLTVVKKRHGKDIKQLLNTEIIVPKTPFPRYTLAQALEIVEKEGHKIPADSKGDLDPTAEKIMAKYVQEKHDHQFVFITDYPISIRPFYHMRHTNNPNLTKSFDLIWKGLEITTGAQREHRYEILKKQSIEKGIKTESIQFYLDFFRFGCPPHGGLGFGLTRMLMVMLDRPNVREVTYLYRGPNRLSP